MIPGLAAEEGSEESGPKTKRPPHILDSWHKWNSPGRSNQLNQSIIPLGGIRGEKSPFPLIQVDE